MAFTSNLQLTTYSSFSPRIPLFASRFFRRLFLPYLLLICAATTVVGVFAAVRLRTAYLDRSREILAGETKVAASNLKNELSPEHRALAEKVRELGEALNCRISIIDERGTVIA